MKKYIHSNQNDIGENIGETLSMDNKSQDTVTSYSKSKGRTFQNIISLNFQEQLLASDFKFGYLLNVVLFSLYNLNTAHYVFYSTMKSIHFVPSLIIFIFMFIGSYCLYKELENILTKANSYSFCLYLEENFGSLCSYIYEIISVLWCGIFILIAYVITKLLLQELLGNDTVEFKYIMSACFCVIIIALNVYESFWMSVINAIITIITTICIIISMILLIIEKKNINDKSLIPQEFTKDVYFGIYSGINVFFASFNLFIVFFQVNHNLTKANFQKKKRSNIFLIGYAFHLIYYVIFLIYSLYESTPSNNNNFISILFNNKENFINKILLICFIVEQILHSNFYLSTLKQVIFKSNLKRLLDNRKFIILLTFVTIAAMFIGSVITDKNDNNIDNIILIGNATLGMIVNLIIPGFVLLKSKFTFKSILLLIFILIVHISNAVSLQEKVFSFLNLNKTT